jgi:preprotein translocase subunit SecB
MGLKTSSAVLDREVLWQLSDKDKPRCNFSEEYKHTTIGEDFFEAEGQYGVTIADGERLALKIECTFDVHMHVQAPVKPEMAKRFAESDLRFVLLPYARYFVTDMTSQMQIPPIVLPLATAMGKARVRSKEDSHAV